MRCRSYVHIAVALLHVDNIIMDPAAPDLDRAGDLQRVGLTS